jgi:hypothetical protein
MRSILHPSDPVAGEGDPSAEVVDEEGFDPGRGGMFTNRVADGGRGGGKEGGGGGGDEEEEDSDGELEEDVEEF